MQTQTQMHTRTHKLQTQTQMHTRTHAHTYTHTHPHTHTHTYAYIIMHTYIRIHNHTYTPAAPPVLRWAWKVMGSNPYFFFTSNISSCLTHLKKDDKERRSSTTKFLAVHAQHNGAQINLYHTHTCQWVVNTEIKHTIKMCVCKYK